MPTHFMRVPAESAAKLINTWEKETGFKVLSFTGDREREWTSVNGKRVRSDILNLIVVYEEREKK